MNTISYVFGNNLYLNITNRCMMACPYCIKHKWANNFHGNDLKLQKEPSAQDIIKNIGDPKKYGEIIFCGYGDALVKPNIVKEVSKWVKDNGGKVRINTAGLANRYHQKNILPQLKGLADAVSISLNGTNPKEHNELNRPAFGEESFDEIIKFAKEAKEYIPQVVITAVELPGLDVSKVEKIAKDAGVEFRVRPYLDENEN
ncbi:TatD family nuclease-associated radical SAM protein [Endomicrobium proavitum]|uniref:Putative radical SAM-family protein n=1 Tax=Endomicrobium proavitum TaxID=1408281 RepID=A0A0G3WHQ8_9BACT|nr:TatD family nuclease-associated radical SAM protein [Endomicrobium proavitum]AKL97440.1 Putative radical SAM-family protein [Endomicrobium proavitum]